MTAEILFKNHNFLVDYVYGNLSESLEEEICHLADLNPIIKETIDAIFYLAITLDLDGNGLKAKLDSLDAGIRNAVANHSAF